MSKVRALPPLQENCLPFSALQIFFLSLPLQRPSAMDAVLSTPVESDFDIGLRRMVEAFVTITWLALNLGLNFFNKWAFTPDDENFDGAGFTFPIFFTMWNMGASGMVLQISTGVVPACFIVSSCTIIMVSMVQVT